MRHYRMIARLSSTIDSLTSVNRMAAFCPCTSPPAVARAVLRRQPVVPSATATGHPHGRVTSEARVSGASSTTENTEKASAHLNVRSSIFAVIVGLDGSQDDLLAMRKLAAQHVRRWRARPELEARWFGLVRRMVLGDGRRTGKRGL
ncbi:unnamed protein product [Cyclocybe aegerita]|uniref:Uncharacterized protein n=1 Tax=Cyclocybe aegerita TaxID=1973307 RepID=A0A8S0WT84_CYCAE|nr:unnamed protein product [Cyclocybe aegerita]